MAISAGDFRTGLTLIIDGDPCQVLDFQHVKPGKGAAILKTKMRNLKTGAIQEKNFNASTKFDQANISKKAAQFSYEADNTFYFMDMETYDTYELSVVETDPAIKGAPSNQTKDAVTETGLTLRVPQFIEQGEKIVVFSADGKYAGRA